MKAIVVGGGFGGLSAACYLTRDGYDVTVLEKNDQVGGRAMVMEDSGYTFDLGPSWYMMPDVFEEFFADFDKEPSDYYDLRKLDPSYKVFFGDESHDVPSAPEVYELFEKLEPGSGKQLEKLLNKTKEEYDLVRGGLLGRPMLSMNEVMVGPAARMLTRPELAGSYHRRIARYINDPRLQKILEFMVVFLGGSPKNIPALYSLMAHVDMGLGIWYPMGGMNRLVQAFLDLAKELGVVIKTSAEVFEIERHDSGFIVHSKTGQDEADVVVANADYHHVETQLINAPPTRNWDRHVLSPSGLLVYLGVDTRVPALRHHSLFFDVDWDEHFSQVFEKKVWSEEPLFYVGAPSRTDSSVAPKGCENIFILAPMANGLKPDKQQMNDTADKLIARLSQQTGVDIAKHTQVRHVRAQQYFTETFNAYQGNAFGLAHTMKQSAIFRPKIKSPRMEGLYYVGQYTNPGTGVPLVTLSGKVVAQQIAKDMS